MKNRIDDYNNTVYAILGFLNTYKHELKGIGSDLSLFQGRKLLIGEESVQEVTPDLGLSIGTEGLIGEVKYSFPNDDKHWQDDFDQLKKYERITHGWPTKDGKVNQFDIVLLVQQSRSRVVRDFYIEKVPAEKKITKPFAIIEFNRASQGKEYFHFRIEYGNVTNSEIQKKLYKGLYIPWDIFLTLYAKVKIYDVEPPMPLLLMYIYECVIDKVQEDGVFKRLTPKSSQQVDITVQDFTNRLQEVYSFKGLQTAKYSKHQPAFPKQEWIKRAFDVLAQIGEGSWMDKVNGSFAYKLSQRGDDILKEYIEKTLGKDVVQVELFN